MILFINACVRSNSRTKRLADHLIAKLSDRQVKEVRIWEMELPEVNEDFINWRNECCSKNDFSDPVFDHAKEFAAADTIVIAAPYWDLSFPSLLKRYLEQLCVVGLTFFYNEQNLPQGLCKAKKLYYVTTAGGPIISDAFGYGYIKETAQTFFNIPEFRQFKAEMLDIVGYDAEAILSETIREIDSSDLN